MVEVQWKVTGVKVNFDIVYTKIGCKCTLFFISRYKPD